MIRFRATKNSALSFFISAAVAILIVFGGCKSQDSNYQELVSDLAVLNLSNIAENAEASDRGKRAEAALSKLTNGILDNEPILIQAVIGLPDPNEPTLYVIYFDEDRDLRGLRIKEQSVDPNDMTKTLEEDYPVFVNSLKPFISEHVSFPIKIRDKNQRKDICLWLEYANWNLDGLIRKYVDKRQQNSGDISKVEIPRKETPPIYISVPDPNRVQVFMSVYDRAGHESEIIELLATPRFKLFKSEHVP